jgi:hypothetical protein
MKRIKNWILFFLILCLTVMLLNNCSKDAPFESRRYASGDFNDRLIKNEPDNGNSAFENTMSYSAIAYFSKIFNHYSGTALGRVDSSVITICPSSLTPPSEESWGKNVTITMMIDRDTVKNLLLFTFGPSGCSFEPAADLWISWKALGTKNATLYYIDENNNYIEQEPVEVDYLGKRIKMKIHHFSRYAVAYSDALPKEKLIIAE